VINVNGLLISEGGEHMASRGKGWFGDSQGHAKAGRKGGLARSKRNRVNNFNSR
jgi:hypothetical protein